MIISGYSSRNEKNFICFKIYIYRTLVVLEGGLKLWRSVELFLIAFFIACFAKGEALLSEFSPCICPP